MGVSIGNYCTFAYRCSVFSQSDDYFGNSMVNSTIPEIFKNEIKKEVLVMNHVIVGASSLILPGVTVAEGTSIGASSLLTKSTEPWGLYYGIPAIRQKERSKRILDLLDNFENTH